MTPTNYDDKRVLKFTNGDELGIRCLIEHPVRGWRVFSLKKAISANVDDLHLPEHPNQTIRVAWVYVSVKLGKVIALRQLHIYEWHLDADGRIDQGKMMAGIIEKLEQGTSGQAEEQQHHSDAVSDTDLLAIRHGLGLTLPIPI